MESEHGDKRHPGVFKGMSTPLRISVSTHLRELKVSKTYMDPWDGKKKKQKSSNEHG